MEARHGVHDRHGHGHAQVCDGEDTGHVRFAAEQLVNHDNEIQVKQAEDRVEVHLGFLQILHRYEIRFAIKDDLGEDVEADPLQNLHVQIKHIMPTEDGEGHELTIDFNAHREKLLKEPLVLTSCLDKDKELTIVLNARVLGKGKGTPALKNGIKCYRVDYDDDSDTFSDWQGF